ncbi:hypothetical protein [Desulfosporosinus meridiei]|uniref:Uncharacterized protein n=1 Tax=Desulfosporosinus meridiei (strain ATCC BAA-275 / DSM 13257 / KCTC 12902 / NCIMB 13706 / S10) TaxID=768704 RepID=J7IUN7_DESMD|nr:hypothetical protein [Desulfosporosinus meridiei]AFQ45445.1 hypothetical protein Desmer_3608 [Desulfosporosinus meridiei DSM 13257]
MDLYWLTQAVAYWSLVLFFIPPYYIKKLMLFSFLGGFVYTWIVQIIAVNILKRWIFEADIFMIYNIPVFFTISWFAVTTIFGYLLWRFSSYQIWIVIFFTLWATLMNLTAVYLERISLPEWSIPETFMFAIFSHVLLLYVFKYMHHVDALGANEEMFKDSFMGFRKR